MARGYHRKHRYTVRKPNGRRIHCSSKMQVQKVAKSDGMIELDTGDVTLEVFKSSKECQ